MKRKSMESLTGKEKIPLVSFEQYIDYIVTESLIDGKRTYDSNHAFFMLLAREKEFQDIDGFPIDSIFTKNVIENGMDADLFMGWCRAHNIPTPKNEDGTFTQVGKDFTVWYDAALKQQKEAYELWASRNGIDTSEYAIMRFIDKDALSHLVYTDFEHRGNEMQSR
jgi:hypothetical protein